MDLQLDRAGETAPSDGASRSVPQLIESALAGRATMLLLVGRNGDDVHSVIDSLVRPTAVARGVRDLVEVTGLAWEAGLEFGVMDRLGLDRADPTKSLSRAAANGPVVFVVAEAQDADARSLRALSSAIHRLHDVPVLIVVAGTVADPTQEDDSLLSELRRAHRRTTCVIEALDANGVREIASNLGVTLDEGVARRLCRHTDGSPAALSELLTHFDPAAWKAPDTQIPPTHSALTRTKAELAAAGPGVTALVEACAAIGRWVSIEEAGAIAELADPLPVLDEALTRGLLRVRRASLRLLVGFPNRMARAAAYESMGVARQRALHRRAAETMTDKGLALRQEALAAGGPNTEVAARLDAYAEKCAAEGVWDTAGEAWLAASRLSTDQADQDRRLISCVDAKVSAGNLYDALALIPELERTMVSAQRDGVLGYHQLLLGHRDEADMLLRRAWQGAQDEGNCETAAVVAHRLALHSLVDWDAAGLVEWCERASVDDADSVPGLEARTMYGLGLAGMGRTEAALQVYADVTGTIRTGGPGPACADGPGLVAPGARSGATGRPRTRDGVADLDLAGLHPRIALGQCLAGSQPARPRRPPRGPVRRGPGHPDARRDRPERHRATRPLGWGPCRRTSGGVRPRRAARRGSRLGAHRLSGHAGRGLHGARSGRHGAQ